VITNDEFDTICSDLVQKKTTVFAMFFDIDAANLTSRFVTDHSLRAHIHTADAQADIDHLPNSWLSD